MDLLHVVAAVNGTNLTFVSGAEDDNDTQQPPFGTGGETAQSSSSSLNPLDFPLPLQLVAFFTATVTSSLSILGSGTMIFVFLSHWKELILMNVKYRLLLALCLADVVNSLFLVVWPVFLPKGTMWGALGNRTTCNIQGFFFHLGLIGSFYTTALAAYFLFCLRDNMSNQEISRRYECMIHAVSLLFPILTGFVLLLLDSYSVNGYGCYVGPDPPGCSVRPSLTCKRAEWGYLYIWLFAGIPLLFMFAFITYAMYNIYITVKKVSERAIQRSSSIVIITGREGVAMGSRRRKRRRRKRRLGQHQYHMLKDESQGEETNTTKRESTISNISMPSTTTMNTDSSMTRSLATNHYSHYSRGRTTPRYFQGSSYRYWATVATTTRTATMTNNVNNIRLRHERQIRETSLQAFLYVSVFAVTRSFTFLIGLIEQCGVPHHFILTFLHMATWPSQGLFNVLIFLRPQVSRLRERHTEWTYWQCLRYATFHFKDTSNTTTPNARRRRANRVHGNAGHQQRLRQAREGTLLSQNKRGIFRHYRLDCNTTKGNALETAPESIDEEEMKADDDQDIIYVVPNGSLEDIENSSIVPSVASLEQGNG